MMMQCHWIWAGSGPCRGVGTFRESITNGINSDLPVSSFIGMSLLGIRSRAGEYFLINGPDLVFLIYQANDSKGQKIPTIALVGQLMASF
jgi:hypothetical protein